MKLLIPALGLQRNGGNRVLIAVVNALAERGVDCEFLVPAGQDQPGFELHPRVRITPLGRPHRSKVLRWLLFMLAAVPRLRRQKVLANHFLTAVSATLALGLFGRPYVSLVQDLEYRFYPPPLSWLAWAACRLTWRTSQVLPANPYLAEQLRQRRVQVQQTLRLGVARAFTGPRSAHPRDLDVLMILRHGRHKRLDRYQKIAAALADEGLKLAAIAPEAALFEQLGSPLAVQCVPQEDAELVELMDRSRIFLMASEHEGFALPPLEAMARAAAIVLFPSGGPSVYARDGENCVIVQDQREETAVAEILSLLADEERRLRLAEAGQRTAQGYQLEAAAAEAAEVIQARLKD